MSPWYPPLILTVLLPFPISSMWIGNFQPLSVTVVIVHCFVLGFMIGLRLGLGGEK